MIVRGFLLARSGAPSNEPTEHRPSPPASSSGVAPRFAYRLRRLQRTGYNPAKSSKHSGFLTRPQVEMSRTPGTHSDIAFQPERGLRYTESVIPGAAPCVRDKFCPVFGPGTGDHHASPSDLRPARHRHQGRSRMDCRGYRRVSRSWIPTAASCASTTTTRRASAQPATTSCSGSGRRTPGARLVAAPRQCRRDDRRVLGAERRWPGANRAGNRRCIGRMRLSNERYAQRLRAIAGLASAVGLQDQRRPAYFCFQVPSGIWIQSPARAASRIVDA